MLIITREELRQAVSMSAAMDAVAAAFAQLSSQRAQVPLRPHLSIPPAEGLALIMPAYLAESNTLAVKLLTLFPHNQEQHNLPTINALVLLFDTSNGLPLALIEGSTLTALRTGAASGVATRLLARGDAHVLTLFGAGAQALPQAWAVCEARSIERIWLVNRTRASAERLAGELRAFGPPIPRDAQVALSSQAALAEADVICCATASPTPLFHDADLRPGTHINGIGSYRSTMQEVPVETVGRARIVADQHQAAWSEAGDLIIARDQGYIKDETQIAELGEVILGRAPGRTDEQQLTFFKSVGNAVQDVAMAQAAYTLVRAKGLGTEVTL
jgi:ornithine cyclodeaminase/alanine dehydrogenase-like protein (mu-crystallin family)